MFEKCRYIAIPKHCLLFERTVLLSLSIRLERTVLYLDSETIHIKNKATAHFYTFYTIYFNDFSGIYFKIFL